VKWRDVPVEMPGRLGMPGEVGTITDSLENRALLEEAAIPRCREWREANPECIHTTDVGSHECNWQRAAPYCCSAYCDRCAGLRALDGVVPLLPNDWMTQ
jgi:hypothetical protein